MNVKMQIVVNIEAISQLLEKKKFFFKLLLFLRVFKLSQFMVII